MLLRHLNYSVGNWNLVWATLVRQSNVLFAKFQNRFEKRGPTKVGIIEPSAFGVSENINIQKLVAVTRLFSGDEKEMH